MRSIGRVCDVKRHAGTGLGFVLVLLLTGCGVTSTPVPTPPATAAPTATAELPPATAEPPTATPQPPTATAELPTVTPEPPMATAEPATATAPAATATVAAPGASVPPPMTGEVVYMAGPREEGGSSLMKRIWNWQLEHGNVPECPECVDAVALVEPDYLGRKVWLRHPNGDLVGPLMVVDSAAEEHRANLRARGRLGDVSWELAQRWKMTGPLDGVTLYFEPPAE